MHPETEQLLGILELLTEPSLPLNLPDHDGAFIVPFIWDISEQGEFNVMNLTRVEGWLQLTDADVTIESWQEMEYLKYFPDFSMDAGDRNIRKNIIANLFQVLNHELQELQSFVLKGCLYPEPDASPSFIIGQTQDGDWIGVCPTFYKETYIPQEHIDRSPLSKEVFDLSLGDRTLNLISQLEAIISELGAINVSGDFGAGYCYDYAHQITIASATTQELVFEKALQLSNTLEIHQFNAFYPDLTNLYDFYYDDYEGTNTPSCRYDKINQFMKHTFEETFMYRLSFWDRENIYAIGKTRLGNWAGFQLKSLFVYNP